MQSQKYTALKKRLENAIDPKRRFVDLCIQLKVHETGELSRPFGGVWDKRASKYVSIYSPDRGWLGSHSPPTKIHVMKVAQQSYDYIMDFDSDVVLALGGRRSGKTTGSLAPKLLIMLICFPGKIGQVLSPTYRQSLNVWRAVLKVAPRSWFVKQLKQEHRLWFINGAELALMSADNVNSTRGEGVAWGAYDERQEIQEEAAMNAFLSTSEGDGCSQIFETATISPELRDHYDKLMKDPFCKVYRMRSRGNPFIDHSLFDNAERLLDKESVQRELEAEWPKVEGRVYYPFDMRHVVSYPAHGQVDDTGDFLRLKFDSPVFGNRNDCYLIGIDPPRHATIFRVYRNGVIHVVDEIVINADGKGGDVRDLAEKCRARIGKDSYAVVVCDPHESHWLRDVKIYFKKEGFRMSNVPQMLNEYRVTAVRGLLEKNKLLIDPKCVTLIEGLNEQIYIDSKPDKKTKSKIYPQMSMDHILDSMGYVIYKLFPAKLDYARLEKNAKE